MAELKALIAIPKVTNRTTIEYDVQELVRCKDCEHNRDNNYPCERHTIGTNASKDDTWFCADGRKKDE